MLNPKEALVIGISTLVLTLAASFLAGFSVFLYTLLAVFAVLAVNIISKKIAGFYLDSDVQIDLWHMDRYGFAQSKYFKRPIPAGIIFPIVFSLISFGHLIWMACLVFEVKPEIYRAAKRHGLYSYSEMTEYHMGIIAATGIFANLVLAFVGYLIGGSFFTEFSKLSIYYAFFSILPFSDLDGNKVFFGSLVLWSFLATLVLIGLAYAFFLI